MVIFLLSMRRFLLFYGGKKGFWTGEILRRIIGALRLGPFRAAGGQASRSMGISPKLMHSRVHSSWKIFLWKPGCSMYS